VKTRRLSTTTLDDEISPADSAGLPEIECFRLIFIGLDHSCLERLNRRVFATDLSLLKRNLE
jgi:hypothetical protein